MTGEISPARPVQQAGPTTTEVPKTEDQAAVDQAQKNQQAQQAQNAEQAKLEASKKADQPQGLSFEFLSAFSTVVHEGFENYRVPQSSNSSGAYGDAKGQEMQKELQVLREFLREAQRMVLEQKMEMSQVLNQLKVQQGGAFWNKMQQILQKGIPAHQAVLFQRLDKDAGDIKHKFGAPEIPTAIGEKAGEAAKALGNPAGQALAEMLKAEANPTTQIEHMILALQILHREGMRDSSQKLLGYLKHRWGMSEEELRRFLSEHNLPYYLGPMPRKNREEKAQGTFWYPALALVAVPIGMLVGMDFIWALVLGIALMGFVLIFTAQRKS